MSDRRPYISVLFSLLWLLTVFGRAHASNGLNVHDLYLKGEPINDDTFAVIRDTTGYLWIGTDNGLKRYDGYTLRNFINDPNDPDSIGSNTISSLHLDEYGILWAGGTNLNRFIPQTHKFERHEVSDGYAIWALYRDDNDIIWFGGEGFGLRGYDLMEGKLVHQLLSEPRARFITAIAPALDGKRLWVASSAGLFRFDPRTLDAELFDVLGEIGGGADSVRDMHVDRDGRVWLATQKGVITFRPETGERRHYRAEPDNPLSLSTSIAWSVHQDRNGQIWIGTDKEGVHRYLPEKDGFEHFPSSVFDDFAFPPGAVNDIYEDETGNLWFAITNHGVRRVSEHLEKFTAIRHNALLPDSLGYDNVLDLLEDSNGHIWVATDGGGLDRYDTQKGLFTHYRYDPKDPHSIGSDSVISLAEGPEGNLWIGTWAGGLNRFDPETGRFTRYLADDDIPGPAPAGNNVFRILATEDNRLLLSIWRRGLQVFDPVSGEIETFFPGGEGSESGIVNFSINEIVPDGDGRYWLAGHSGLELFDLKTRRSQPLELDLAGSISDVFLDGELLWIATSKNLVRYQRHTGEQRVFTVEDGLADNFVVSIEKDAQGFLWLGTRKGLNRFDPEREFFESFDEKDGLAGSKFNRYSHLSASDGRMYFGGSQGISVFNPAHLPRNDVLPKVVLTGLELFQRDLTPGNSALLEHHAHYTPSMTLEYDQRDITFEFTALNFVSPAKNRYRYRLFGLETEWTEVGSDRRRARYTNLDPGQYTFQVIGSNNEGVWNRFGAQMELVVRAPWWQTWWARLGALLSLGGLVYLVLWWRLRINYRRERELAELVSAKTSELERANYAVLKLNEELEQRVEQRTKELSIEVEERRFAERKLFHMAFHDSLTGLPNRHWLLQQLEALIDAAQTETGSNFGLLFLDCDRFKQVNDTHGHLLGDMLLDSVARRLEEMLERDEHAVRLGGDEFTILLQRCDSAEPLISMAERVLEVFQKPFKLDQNIIHFGASIGMVVGGAEYRRAEQVLRDADIAMYRAKEKGKGTYQLFDEKMREERLEIVALENDLYTAVANGELHLVYQPIMRLNDSRLVGFEALLRWEHPHRGLIPPDKFIPIAEESGSIFEIGLWVIREAVAQLAAWQEKFDPEHLPTLAVNLSALQLSQPGMLGYIDEIIDSARIPRANLKFELTESALMENSIQVTELLDGLKERGIDLAIDDFGTGYSSLSYLDKLPVQILKIDRQFIDAMTGPEETAGGAVEIVRATISLAHNLRMQVVAEGIETEQQLGELRDYGCDFGQGYYFSRPLSVDDATNYIDTGLTDKAASSSNH